MASASDSKRALIPECFAQTGLSAAEVCFPDTQGWVALLASQIQRAFEAFLQLSNRSFWGSCCLGVLPVLPCTAAMNRVEMLPGWLCARWHWRTCSRSQMSHLEGPVLTAGLKARHQHHRFIPHVLPWVQDCGSSLLFDRHSAFPDTCWSSWFGHRFVN